MKRIVVANWKLHKTVPEAKEWLETIARGIRPAILEKMGVVVCPTTILLPEMRREISKLKIELSLGAQDVSRFERGAYTGEVSAEQLQGWADCVLVGHSERRRLFGETGAVIQQKLEICLKNRLVPILCFESPDQLPVGSGHPPIVAYEPRAAIGTGQPDAPEDAQKVAHQAKEGLGAAVSVLYGGSVNSGNVGGFISQADIDGVLVGEASLDPEEFLRILEAVRRVS